MIQSTDIITYEEIGFDNEKYIQIQKQAILERIQLFNKGKLYLEIGGKFMIDQHASRVLPGFDPYVKKRIFKELAPMATILFCINYPDIISDRQLSSQAQTYEHTIIKMLAEIEKNLGVRPQVVINRIPKDHKSDDAFVQLTQHLKTQKYTLIQRYEINGYPDNVEKILSSEGFGSDEYAQCDSKLVLVTGAASNSGKMSTCMGQVYLDHLKGEESGYAKYETFPIWNLPLQHPVNLAYEAATIDIGDYNCEDTYHLKAYGAHSVNYNRDVDAFKVLQKLIRQFVNPDNPMHTYRSPTDMGINKAGFAITDDQIVAIASHHEILRRKGRYQTMLSRGDANPSWIKKADELLAKSEEYMKDLGKA